MDRVKNIFGLLFCLVLFYACRQHHYSINPEAELDYCVAKATLTLATGFEEGYMPRNIQPGEVQWSVSRLSNWTAGYWPGALWYLYEYTGDDFWKGKAIQYTNCLRPNWDTFFNRQDFGLSVFLSFGHGYRLTGDSLYLKVLLQSASKIKELQLMHTVEDNLVGQSVSNQPVTMQVILNELRNLNLLLWAGNNGCDQMLAYARLKADDCYNMVNEHFYYEPILRDAEAGSRNTSIAFTELNYENNYLLSKDVAWLIYGFTTLHRDNPEPRYLLLAQNLAGTFISNLPDDYIPGWILGPGHDTKNVKDASAAAIAASALLQLAGLTTNNMLQGSYFSTAERILLRLSSKAYRSNNLNHAFIMHSVGNSPLGSEADVSLIYSDYYYLEALMKYKQLLNKRIHSAEL